MQEGWLRCKQVHRHFNAHTEREREIDSHVVKVIPGKIQKYGKTLASVISREELCICTWV